MLNLMPTRKRKHSVAALPTDKGILIAPVPVPGLTECWSFAWGKKKDIRGSFRMAVGGTIEEEADDADDAEDGADDDELPPGLCTKGATQSARKDHDEGAAPVFSNR